MFTGLHLSPLPDGEVALAACDNGMVTELRPNPMWAKKPLGFYDMEGNPVPDPLGKHAL